MNDEITKLYGEAKEILVEFHRKLNPVYKRLVDAGEYSQSLDSLLGDIAAMSGEIMLKDKEQE